MSQALQAAFHGLGLQLPVVGQQQPAAEREGGEVVPLSMYHDVQVYKVTKKFAKRKQAHVGMKSSKTNQTRRERHHNTFTPSLHLVPFCQNCVFVFVF